LRLFHTDDYLATLKRVSAGELNPADLFLGLGSEDCPVFPDLFDYAVLAAGATITGARLILDDGYEVVFNPSGGFHHAQTEKAGGFCYINDVVLGCRTLADAGKRVFCLDLDAHHGNGTQSAFYDDPRVFTASLHESGHTLYPWGGRDDEIGEGAGRGYNLNLPFPAGTDDDTYYTAFRQVIPPLISAFDPDVIVLEVGMDILSVDPLTHLGMTNNVIADILPLVQQYGKPILALGGGGYSPEDTARGWALSWCVLNRIEMEEDLYMGLGGVFLGSSEWNAGLRDPHFYLRGEQKKEVAQKIAGTVERLKKRFFPLHGV
jgi:acetoin utilization deacetylase AcuC-like enzyme